jgi:hypothetical protein
LAADIAAIPLAADGVAGLAEAMQKARARR